ncbi:glycosyl hydrolase family 95 catalytic domain-containing protein [Micromonospora sp. 067-2]|uniref:glycosyl hydrolase family 95 catalytic domain-containing protein n=1 Tax=Micromonospora sp. 067-2 TaxID=2789270 RepID=UPI00397C8B9C
MTTPNTSVDPASTVLRYSSPARRWTDALPLGNGRLGAMYFGGVGRDRVQLNDETCWSGAPGTAAGTPLVGRREGPRIIADARAALSDGDVRAGEALLRRLQSGHSQSYVALADLWLTDDAADHSATPPGYRRLLHLGDAVAEHAYRLDDGHLQQEAWISAPAQAMILRRRSSARTSLRITVSTPHPTGRTRVWTSPDRSVGGIESIIRMPSQVVPPHESSPDPIRYDPTPGAAVTAIVGVRALAMEGAGWRRAAGLATRDGDVVLVLSTVTDYVDPFTAPHGNVDRLRAELDDRLDRLVGALSRGGYERMRAEHRADHDALFGRVRLRLGDSRESASTGARDTDLRVRDHAAGQPDAALAALVFQYGRYLLISCSRPGGLPATLQGIWNENVRPPWSSNYTTNINLQMNYWSAEVAGLPECHAPLLRWLGHARRRGAEVARNRYDAPGWTLHHNSDAWCFALPAGEGDGDPAWSFWPLGAAWLCRHAFDHYDYGRDTTFLVEQAWPLVRSAAEFCLAWLTEFPDGTLGTSPATSPENHYLAADGEPAAVTVSSTADLALIRDLLGRGLDLLAALPHPDADDLAWAERATAALGRLPAERVGVDGRLAEWATDVFDTEPEHRHTSHLFGVYPAGAIDADVAPALATSARVTLDDRGPKSTGWSLAWRLALRARLRDVDGAQEMLRMFLSPMADDASDEPSMTAPAGVYRNLFCAHPPFQIDGNLGLTAGIAELLMQSHATTADTTVVHLLPTAPTAWRDGSFSGLRARGGVTVDAWWSDGVLREVTVRAGGDRVVQVRYGTWTTTVRLAAHLAHTITIDIT